MSIYKHLVLVYLLLPALGYAQTAVQSPTALSTIPKGATATNPFWQHLVIDLSGNPSAGNTISIVMPPGINVADINGDGSVEDDISIDNETLTPTGYKSTVGSTPDRIVLVTGTGGSKGPVHVQFPIVTEATPASASVVYGLITFSNPNELPIPAGIMPLVYVDPFQLNLSSLDNAFLAVLGRRRYAP